MANRSSHRMPPKRQPSSHWARKRSSKASRTHSSSFWCLPGGDPLDPLGLINGQVAVTDRRLRFGNEVGDNVGPGDSITEADTPTFRYAGGYTGWNRAVRDGRWRRESELLVDKAWKISGSLYFNNGPFDLDNVVPLVAEHGDLYSIQCRGRGDAQRVMVFSDQIASRTPLARRRSGRPLRIRPS